MRAPLLGNHWFARLTAGGRWIRTCSTAARKPGFLEHPGHRGCLWQRARAMWQTLGGQYRRHQYRLERLSALVLNDHAYDKLTGWSNVIPVVPVKGDATETYKFLKEESHGTRSTPHRHRT